MKKIVPRAEKKTHKVVVLLFFFLFTIISFVRKMCKVASVVFLRVVVVFLVVYWSRLVVMVVAECAK